MQEWRFTRFVDFPVHDSVMCIKPDELVGALGRHGLRAGEIVGLGPRVNKSRVLLNFIRANRGRISYGELSRRMDVGQIKSTSISYMGFATKSG